MCIRDRNNTWLGTKYLELFLLNKITNDLAHQGQEVIAYRWLTVRRDGQKFLPLPTF